MSPKRVAAVVVGLCLAAVWLAAAAGGWSARRTPGPAGLRPVAAEAPAAAVAAAIRVHSIERAGRGVARSNAIRRNLFQLAPAPRARQAVGPTPPPSPAALTPATDPSSEPPPIVLLGIGETGAPPDAVRTAVLGGVRDVWIVKEGDLVEARFRILRITPVAVEVLDTVSQRALALRWQ